MLCSILLSNIVIAVAIVIVTLICNMGTDFEKGLIGV